MARKTEIDIGTKLSLYNKRRDETSFFLVHDIGIYGVVIWRTDKTGEARKGSPFYTLHIDAYTIID